MKIQVQHTEQLNGSITAPPSKSHTIRALFIATLARGKSVIENALDAHDTQCALEVCRALGADVGIERPSPCAATITIESRGTPLLPSDLSFMSGDSGLTTHFALPIMGLCSTTVPAREFYCGAQMRTRPIEPLLCALEQLGLRMSRSASNQPWPLLISGELQGGHVLLDGRSSQYISSLLFALPLAFHDSEIVVSHLNERPYVHMTTRWLDEQGIHYSWEQAGSDDVFRISGNQRYHAFTKKIGGDFSSASFILAAAALHGGEVIIRGLDLSDTQGDKRLVALLSEMGADITTDGDAVHVRGGQPLCGISIDCNDIPDLVPVLAVLGTCVEGTTTLLNVSHARDKETDRLTSMSEELRKMGAEIYATDDGLSIVQSTLRGVPVNGRGDHRTVMALAVAGMSAWGETVVESAESIAKTYPHFFDDMKFLGATLQTI